MRLRRRPLCSLLGVLMVERWGHTPQRSYGHGLNSEARNDEATKKVLVVSEASSARENNDHLRPAVTPSFRVEAKPIPCPHPTFRVRLKSRTADGTIPTAFALARNSAPWSTSRPVSACHWWTISCNTVSSTSAHPCALRCRRLSAISVGFP